jgi:hypothetical protein
MKTHIVLVTAVILIAATAVSTNSMSVYAQGGANMTGGGANMTGEDVGKLAPGGSATGLVKQGEKFFIVLCPPVFQDIKQCQILVAQPTTAIVKSQ